MKKSYNFNSIFCFKNCVIIMLIMFFVVNVLKSQTNYIVVGKKYSTVKMNLKNYKLVKAKNLILIDDTTLQFNNFVTGSKEVVPVKNIRFMSEKKGTYALTYGIVGAGIGLLSALYGISSVKADPTLDDSDVNWSPFIFGFTAGGAAIGALIGACIPKYKRLYFQDKSTSYNFKVVPNIANNYYGVGLTVKF